MKLFSMQLNEVTAGLATRLPPSDTRQRWDLRALEEGRFKQVRLPAVAVPYTPNHCLLLSSGVQGVHAQAAAGQEVFKARETARVAAYCAKTGTESLPPRWFELRAPDSLERPFGEGLRFRRATLHPQNLGSLMNGTAQRRRQGHMAHGMHAISGALWRGSGTRAATGSRAQQGGGRALRTSLRRQPKGNLSCTPPQGCNSC